LYSLELYSNTVGSFYLLPKELDSTGGFEKTNLFIENSLFPGKNVSGYREIYFPIARK